MRSACSARLLNPKVRAPVHRVHVVLQPARGVREVHRRVRRVRAVVRKLRQVAGEAHRVHPERAQELVERLAGRREVAGRGVEVAEAELVGPDRLQARRVEVLPDLGGGRLPGRIELVRRSASTGRTRTP